MPEELAREKFACPACGAEAIWNPAKQALVCPFCGTTSPAKLDAGTGGIIEHDLVTALRGITDDKRGWQTEKRYVKCQSCQAISVLDPQRQAQRCDFCGSAQLIPYEQTKDAFRPESLLPFKVTEDKARDGIRTWYGRVWLPPQQTQTTAPPPPGQGHFPPPPDLPSAGAALRLLWLGAAHPLRADQGRVPARKPAAVQGDGGQGARWNPHLVWQVVARPEQAQALGAHRHGQGHLPTVLDLRCEGRRGVDRGGGVLLLHDGIVYR